MTNQLRVYHIQNPLGTPTWHEVASPLEGIQKIEALANMDMRPQSNVWGNIFGLSVLEDGEWVDWYDDDYDDIDAWAEKNGVTRDSEA